MNKIAILLPYNEHYNYDHFGAVALVIRDFIINSKFKNNITVFGAFDAPDSLTKNYRKLTFKTNFLSHKYKSYLESFLKIIKQENYKLIEIHNRPKWIDYLVLNTHLPITLHLHNDPLTMKNFKTTSERKNIIKKVAKIICVSNWVNKRVLSNLLPSLKVTTIYNSYHSITKNDSINKENTIIYVGRIIEEKGVIELFTALKKLLIENKLNDWNIVIIGKPQSKSIFNKSYRILKSFLSINYQNIHYYEHKPFEEIIKCFGKAKIAVLPSKWNEPFGRTILEALSMGCALITSNTGAIPEIVDDSAVMLKTITAENIEIALENLINHPNEIDNLSLKAFTQAKKFIFESNSAEKIDNIRTEILKNYN